MASRTNHKTRAIILRSIDYGESDRIVTFFTDEFGKVKGIAKGARRSKKRFANALENFSQTLIVFSRRSPEGLALIEACDVGNHHPGIRTDLEKMLTAAYLAEVIDQFTLEGKKNEKLFRLLEDFLDLLEAGPLWEGVVRIFELRLLRILGYEPALDRCVGCKTPVGEMKQIFFDPRDGGLRCGDCAPRVREVYPLSAGTVKTLLLGRDTETGRLSRIVFSAQAHEESRQALTSFIRHLLGRELKSLNVLNEIKRMAL